MRIHVLAAVTLTLTAASAAFAADTAVTANTVTSDACSDSRLSATDQSNCRIRMSSANTAVERDQVRREYTGRLSAYGSTAAPVADAPATTLPDAAATPPFPRTPGTASTYDPASGTTAKRPQ